MRARYGSCIALIAIVLAAAPGVRAQATPEGRDAGPGPNVRITLAIGGGEKQTGPRERTYRLVTRPGVRAEMLMGWRTPIPAKRREMTSDGDVPTTSYTYQNVGVSATLELTMIAADRMLLEGVVEVSGPKGGMTSAPSDAPPMIGTFQQNLSVTLQSGKPLRVAEVPDHEGGTLYLEVRADVEE